MFAAGMDGRDVRCDVARTFPVRKMAVIPEMSARTGFPLKRN
jgi:hypothetical protein